MHARRRPRALHAVITPGAPEAGRGPHQAFIDVHFPEAPVDLQWITFENYYSASISILHSPQPAPTPAGGSSSDSSATRWVPVVDNLPLMANPHCEDDAQAWHEIHASQFSREFDAARTMFLRIFLSQPSPLWREHTLRKIAFYMASSAAPPAPALPLPHLSGPAADRCALLLERIGEVTNAARKIRATLAAAPPRRRTESDIVRAYVLNTWDGELGSVELPTPPREPPTPGIGTLGAGASRR
jgi:hypothetical protein